MIVAIDGTLASGKGSIAQRIAMKYGLPHLDTGRLYRATGVAALIEGIDLSDEERLAALAEGLDFQAFDDGDLRTAEAGQAASQVAALPGVRAALLAAQRRFAAQPGGAVLDGRDIGTVICPDAPVKFWVDADVEVRAWRRWSELRARGEALDFNDMLDQVRARDARDAGRANAPMSRAPDAHLIDTTHLTIDQAVGRARVVIESAQPPEAHSVSPD
ncbi:MAG: (d)CMP kinase [Pseudomonadota bacterium]